MNCTKVHGHFGGEESIPFAIANSHLGSRQRACLAIGLLQAAVQIALAPEAGRVFQHIFYFLARVYD